MAWGVVDDESLAEARSIIGVPLRRSRWRWVEVATKDAISHVAEGVGDDNPLWWDEDYGKNSSVGTLLAPPSFLYAVDGTTVAPKMAGVQWIYAACDWTWNDRIRMDDRFEVGSVVLDVEEKSTAFAPRWAMQTGRVDYMRDGERVANAVSKIARLPRGEQLVKDTGGKLKYEQRETHRYTPEELADIEKQVLSEPLRGAEPRYWEDVHIGDAVPAVVKGPLTGTDIVGWYAAVQGARPYGGTHEMVYKYRQKHADFHVNPTTGGRDSAGRGHLEVQTGVDVGMGGAYDIGPQRISWCIHMLTNWMGDDGFLRACNVQVRRPNLIGDTTWWTGTVTGTGEAHGYHYVTIDCVATNQRDEPTAWGDAVVFLPSKTNGAVNLPVPDDLTIDA